MTPYQGFDLLAAWARHVGAAEQVEPLVATGHAAAGEAIALLPLGLRLQGGIRSAEFLGGEHANYNLPLFRVEHYPRLGPGDLATMLDHLRAEARVDLFDLQRQPDRWAGRPNPFLLPGSQPSPSFAYSGALDRPFAELYEFRVSKSTRSKDRKKLRRLQDMGELRFFRAESRADRRRVLDAFFAQKATRFAARGIPNIFDERGTRAFLEEACGLRGEPTALDLYGFSVGGTVVATLGVAMQGGRASAMINSIMGGPIEAYSPGIALMHAMIADVMERGGTWLDFGVGAATYKGRFCPETDRLLDGVRGVSAVGRLAAFAIRTKLRAKRRIKTAPWLWAMMESARRRRHGAPAAGELEPD